MVRSSTACNSTLTEHTKSDPYFLDLSLLFSFFFLQLLLHLPLLLLHPLLEFLILDAENFPAFRFRFSSLHDLTAVTWIAGGGGQRKCKTSPIHSWSLWPYAPSERSKTCTGQRKFWKPRPFTIRSSLQRIGNELCTSTGKINQGSLLCCWKSRCHKSTLRRQVCDDDVNKRDQIVRKGDWRRTSMQIRNQPASANPPCKGLSASSAWTSLYARRGCCGRSWGPCWHHAPTGAVGEKKRWLRWRAAVKGKRNYHKHTHTQTKTVMATKVAPKLPAHFVFNFFVIIWVCAESLYL